MAQVISQSDKLKIVKRLQDHITKEGNGYCGVRWASKQVLPEYISIKDYNVESIAALATESGKFKKEKVLLIGDMYDYNISIDSSSNWLTRNPIKIEIIRFVVTVAAAVLISYMT